MKGRGFMSLYGINAYTSNSYYSSLLAGKNSSLNSAMTRKSTTLSDMLSSALKTDQGDLYAIAKKAQMVRSRDYQKELIEGFKEYFYGTSEKTESEEDKTAKENADKLAESSKALNDSASSMFLDGKNIFSDPEKTLSTVKSFVDSYNNTIDGLKNSEDTKVLQRGMNLVNSAKAYSRTLKRVGISVGSDNKMTLDTEKLSKAPETTLNSLFTGSYSLAHRVADKASYISRAAKLENQTTYNSKGTTTDLFNRLAASMFEGKV